MIHNKYISMLHWKVNNLNEDVGAAGPHVQSGYVSGYQQGNEDEEQKIYRSTIILRHEIEASINKFVKIVEPLVGGGRATREVARTLMGYVESNDRSLTHGIKPPYAM